MGRKVSDEEIINSQDAIFEVACLAKAHLETAKDLCKVEQNKHIKFLLHSAIISEIYLEELRKCHFNPFKLNLNDPSVVLKYQGQLIKQVVLGIYK